MEGNQRNTARLVGRDGSAPARIDDLAPCVDPCEQQRAPGPSEDGTPGTAANEGVLVLRIFKLAQRCSLRGDQATARHLYQLLLPYQDRVITIAAGGTPRPCAAAYFVGLLAVSLADWDAAIQHFHHALSVNEHIAATFDAAQTRYAYASVLVIRDAPGDWEHARNLLSTTVSLLDAADLAPTAAWPPGPRAPHILVAEAAPGNLPSDVHAGTRNIFRPAGDYWTIAYEAKECHIRDVRGLQYIARLLRHPHQDLHVLDLVGASLDATGPLPRQVVAENGLSVASLDGALPLLDPSARRAYVARLRDLRADLADAAQNNDLGRSGTLQREIQFLTDELLAASRPGGRCATTASPAERARISVRNAITGALKAIAAHHRDLAQHLGNAIRTGTTCCYAPDRAVEWTL